MTGGVLHEPRLDTILMVEAAIKRAKSYPSKAELWRSLPKGIQYQTLTRILDYLEASNKIIHNRGSIVWVGTDNPKLRVLLRESVRLR